MLNLVNCGGPGCWKVAPIQWNRDKVLERQCPWSGQLYHPFPGMLPFGPCQQWCPIPAAPVLSTGHARYVLLFPHRQYGRARGNTPILSDDIRQSSGFSLHLHSGVASLCESWKGAPSLIKRGLLGPRLHMQSPISLPPSSSRTCSSQYVLFHDCAFAHAVPST